MQLNIDANRHMVKTGSITAQTLKWGSDISSFLPAPDYILLADCIYYPQVHIDQLITDLLTTLEARHER